MRPSAAGLASHALLILSGLTLAASCRPTVPTTVPVATGGATSTVTTVAKPNAPVPPIAEPRAHEVTSPHGTRTDEYYWLRDDSRTDPDVLAYLRAENAYKDAMLGPVKSLQDALFQEIVGRIKQDDATVPYRYRGFHYYTRYEEGKEYPIHARKRGSVDAAEEILLNVNVMAKGHEYYGVAGQTVSPSGTRLVYGEDTSGRRQYTLRIKDLATGQTFDDEIPDAKASAVWADDNRTLFYVEKDPVTLLGVRVRKHILGTDSAEDPVIYEEPDHSFYMSVGRTADDAYITINLSSTVSNEVRFLAASNPTGTFRVLVPRARDLEYDADHIGQRWVIRTNHQAKNFRIVQLGDREVGHNKGWKELVAHDEAVFIDDFTVFDDYLVVAERSGGLERLQIRPWKGSQPEAVKFEEAAYSTWIDVNAEPDTPWLRYGYTSMTTPRSIWEINMKTGERRQLKQHEVPGYDGAGYATERRWATARDGVRIPVSLVYRKGFQKNGTAPLYQYGYGSYGSSMDPSFRSGFVSLLDRGFVFALAHIRGGQEMGRKWYEDGKLLKKKNTFTDFIDVTEFLVKEGYAAADKVVAGGGSAGGLLMGAVVNMRPDLYRAIVADVPFMDVVTTMLDESVPLTTNEFDEWGNPREKQYYDYMLSYSPYDNVTAQDYPAMLVTTGLSDSQVQYYEPAKWVARLRATKTDPNPVLFHINMEAGHGGTSGRFRSQRELAQELAFVLQQLGMTG